MSKEILMFVGPSGAGKDVVVDRVTLLTGAESVSLSDQVRKVAHETGMVCPTRGELQILANEMRTLYGEDIFARLAIETVQKLGGSKIIINGVRNPAELEILKLAFNDGKTSTVGINASKEVRFKRVINRARNSDPKNWDEFLECDERENGTIEGKTGQQNYQCLLRADVVLENESDSIENLEYLVDMLVDRLIKYGTLKEMGSLRINGPVERKHLVVLNGPHGAGKSTIGRSLAVKFAAPYLEEIGGKLRGEVKYNSLDSTSEFDREVMRRELLRDHQTLRDSSATISIVETWHTGNIAYALKRSPDIALKYIEILRKQLLNFEVHHLQFVVSDEVFLKRVSENVGRDELYKLLLFYKDINKFTKDLYQSFGFRNVEIDNSDSLKVATDQSEKEFIDFKSN